MERSIRQSNLPELFEKALKFGGNTHIRDDIVEGISSGRFQYWGDDDAVVITEIIEYPRGKKLHVFIAAGNFEHMNMTWLPALQKFARDNGCSSITTTARHGFIRRLPRLGWKPTHTVFELKVEV